MLNNKKIIITGSSYGLGATCAQAFAEQGAQLVLIARTKAKLDAVREACKNSHEHLCIAADLTDFSCVPSIIRQSLNWMGDIDTVLHTVGGGLGFRETLLDSARFQSLFNLNVLTAAELNRSIIPKMKESGKGALIHVGSIASVEAVASLGYNTVKAALSAYVRSLGREIAHYNIVATGILPGAFLAPDNAMQRLKKNKPEVFSEFIERRLPRKEMAHANQIIPLLEFMCSSDISMLSGCMISIDGGEGTSYAGI